MQQIGRVSVEVVKNAVPPLQYYRTWLRGAPGQTTGGGWYRWQGLCPFHADKTPGSFHINSKTGAFKCFSCGAKGGDIIAFHMKARGKTFRESLSEIQETVQ